MGIRCALVFPNSGNVMWLLAVAYGLIQSHPSMCSALLHRDDAVTVDTDPFDPDASLADGVAACANSALWELIVLKRHHLPMVSRMATLFETNFWKKTSQRIDCEDFLDLVSPTLVARELKTQKRRCLRVPPPVAFEQTFDTVEERILYLAAFTGDAAK